MELLKYDFREILTPAIFELDILVKYLYFENALLHVRDQAL